MLCSFQKDLCHSDKSMHLCTTLNYIHAQNVVDNFGKSWGNTHTINFFSYKLEKRLKLGFWKSVQRSGHTKLFYHHTIMGTTLKSIIRIVNVYYMYFSAWV